MQFTNEKKIYGNEVYFLDIKFRRLFLNQKELKLKADKGEVKIKISNSNCVKIYWDIITGCKSVLSLG